MRTLLLVLPLMCVAPFVAAEDPGHATEHMHGAVVKLDKAPIDLTDYASLQRGARLYMNECSGCHSLKFTRYDSLAKGIQITDEDGKVLDQLVKEDLMFVGDSLTDPILSAMHTADGEKWFGIAPPDLTLVARYRGVDWLYTYLRTFYVDPSRPWGVNNLVYPSVAMPHVLVNLQGEQTLTPAGLKITKQGTMTSEEYDRACAVRAA
jgi:ubiquinol-cytochrome c reductase cytochrome c1 subunit